LSLQFFKPGNFFPFLKFFFFLSFGLNLGFDLVGQFLSIFDFFAMPFHEVLLVYLQMLHTLLVHHSFSFIVVVPEVIFIFPFVGAFCFYQLLSSEKCPI
jgi:hypothetical protein